MSSLQVCRLAVALVAAAAFSCAKTDSPADGGTEVTVTVTSVSGATTIAAGGTLTLAGRLPIASYDQSGGGNVGHQTDLSGYTYQVAANGQATIYQGTNPGGRWYLTGACAGLLLGFDYGVSVGGLQPQMDGPLTAPAVLGQYAASTTPGASLNSTVCSGVAASASPGLQTLTMDLNASGLYSPGEQASGALHADPGVNGRLTDTHGNVLYVVSPASFLLLDLSSPYDPAPVVVLFEQ
jgi:hypothetical protein